MGAPGRVAVVELEPHPTAVIAAVTSWAEFPSRWGQLLAEVWAAVRAAGAAAGRNVMLYRDARPSVEVGVELLGPWVARGRVVESALPAGPAARTVAAGAPTAAGIAAAYERLDQWGRDHGHSPDAPSLEIYSHHSEDPAEMYTEVYRLLNPL
jgi:effector-binding domain-containing protein